MCTKERKGLKKYLSVDKKSTSKANLRHKTLAKLERFPETIRLSGIQNVIFSKHSLI